MPSPFYGTDAVYGMRALLGTSNISDIDLGFAALRDDAAAKLKGAVPRVATLPTVGPSGSGALVDGQECYLVADATNGVIWHLRYNAASVSTYKWEFIGGAPLYASVDASESTSSTTYAALTTAGPSITLPTLPSGGDFDVTIGAEISPPAGQYGVMSFDVGGTGAIDGDSAQASVGTGSLERTRRKTGVPSASALAAKYRTSGGGSASFTYRFMLVRPVRVG